MTQAAVPFLFMRGGTSRGPYLHRADLPEDRERLAEALIAMIGAGHPLNIDGIGGGAAVTTKVAMLSPSDDGWADVDYFFAQVGVEERLVDFRPTCGNILVGVGPAAIEMGLVAATGGATDVRIRAVNTGARVLAKVRTEGGAVVYDGDVAIDGVPGTAAPVELRFMDVVGGATGALFPTGARREAIGGIEVSCMDVAMPMVIARADAFGLTGYESAAELDGNRAFYDRMEPIRREAGRRMGLGDVSRSVTPKFGLLAPARDGGTAASRYFMPWSCHPSLAVTGSQCLGACLLCPGTVGEGLIGHRRPSSSGRLPPPGGRPPPSGGRPRHPAGGAGSPARLLLEHPMGMLEVMLEFAVGDDSFDVISAGLVRTARKLAAGEVFVPRRISAMGDREDAAPGL